MDYRQIWDRFNQFDRSAIGVGAFLDDLEDRLVQPPGLLDTLRGVAANTSHHWAAVGIALHAEMYAEENRRWVNVKILRQAYQGLQLSLQQDSDGSGNTVGYIVSIGIDKINALKPISFNIPMYWQNVICDFLLYMKAYYYHYRALGYGPGPRSEASRRYQSVDMTMGDRGVNRHGQQARMYLEEMIRDYSFDYRSYQVLVSDPGR